MPGVLGSLVDFVSGAGGGDSEHSTAGRRLPEGHPPLLPRASKPLCAAPDHPTRAGPARQLATGLLPGDVNEA